MNSVKSIDDRSALAIQDQFVRVALMEHFPGLNAEQVRIERIRSQQRHLGRQRLTLGLEPFKLKTCLGNQLFRARNLLLSARTIDTVPVEPGQNARA